MARKQTNGAAFIQEKAKKITRARALNLLVLLMEGHEIMLRTHPEPEALRGMYLSGIAESMLRDGPRTFDPQGRISWLRQVYELCSELGIDLTEIQVSPS